jgi:hypothetical protein
LRTLAWLVIAAAHTHGAAGLLARATAQRLVHRCPHTGAWTLLFDRAALRFRRCEFVALAALCRAAVDALGPVSMSDPQRSMVSSPFSHN